MRCLGIHVAAGRVYLAVVEKPAEVLDPGVGYLDYPDEVEAPDKFMRVHDDALRLIREHHIDRVRILEPETNARVTYAKLKGRIEPELAVLVAARDAGVDGRRLSRAATRNLLGLGRSGTLSDLVSTVVEAHGPYWNQGRSLAALVGAAGLVE
jgi:hypothetical protein